MPELSEIINSFVIFQLKRSYQKHFSAAGFLSMYGILVDTRRQSVKQTL